MIGNAHTEDTTVSDQSIYEAEGYESRHEYLACLADDYGVDLDTVLALAQVLGPDEDFDGLVSALEDLGDDY